jgi:hypothetical protein
MLVICSLRVLDWLVPDRFDHLNLSTSCELDFFVFSLGLWIGEENRCLGIGLLGHKLVSIVDTMSLKQKGRIYSFIMTLLPTCIIASKLPPRNLESIYATTLPTRGISFHLQLLIMAC